MLREFSEEEREWEHAVRYGEGVPGTNNTRRNRYNLFYRGEKFFSMVFQSNGKVCIQCTIGLM